MDSKLWFVISDSLQRPSKYIWNPDSIWFMDVGLPTIGFRSRIVLDSGFICFLLFVCESPPSSNLEWTPQQPCLNLKGSTFFVDHAEATIVDEGARFEFRCEYGQGTTKWMRRHYINGRPVSESLPRRDVTTVPGKRIEVYAIKNVKLHHSGIYTCEAFECEIDPTVTRARVLQVKRKYKTISTQT